MHTYDDMTMFNLLYLFYYRRTSVDDGLYNTIFYAVRFESQIVWILIFFHGLANGLDGMVKIPMLNF